MTAPVDVLAVMDRAAESAGEIVKASNGDFRAVLYQDDLFKARAAIAELIEATQALLARNSQRDDDEEPETSEAAASRNEHVRMHKRAKAALARVGGAK